VHGNAGACTPQFPVPEHDGIKWSPIPLPCYYIAISPALNSNPHNDVKAPPHRPGLHPCYTSIWTKCCHFPSRTWDVRQAKRACQGTGCSAGTFYGYFSSNRDSLYFGLSQDSLSSSLEIGVAIAIASCASRPCFNPQDFMGDILYHGRV
jgi:hypothetical protein